MQTSEVVVADTSPILNLALIDQLELVREQFATVTLPEQVWEELVAGEEGVESIRAARDAGILEIVTIEQTPLFEEFNRELDIGEAVTLAYAIDVDADLVLLGERDRTGRTTAWDPDHWRYWDPPPGK